MTADKTFAALEAILGYQFKDKNLLKLALTHRSLVREQGDATNQRLEFLGDAVLGLSISDMLYHMFEGEAEGDLSRRQVSLVNGERLATIAEELKLGDALLLSSGEEEQGGRENPSNLEDACEALLGAIYLDGGLDAVKPVVQKVWKPHAEAMKAPPKDPKTALQEWAQARAMALPEYVVISSEGPSHAPYFIIEARLKDKVAKGEGNTKRLAERNAAAAMLKILNASS